MNSRIITEFTTESSGFSKLTGIILVKRTGAEKKKYVKSTKREAFSQAQRGSGVIELNLSIR